MSSTKTKSKITRTSPNSWQARERRENIRYTALAIAGGIVFILGCILGYINAHPGQKRYEILSTEAFKTTAPTPEAFIPAFVFLVLGTILLIIGVFHFIDIASLGFLVIFMAVVMIGTTFFGALPQDETQKAFNQWLNKEVHLSQVNTDTFQTSKNGVSIPQQEITKPVLMKTNDNKLVFVTFHNNKNVITYTTKPAEQ